ncbi:PREDICTED: uncharacterized protein LOC106109258 [Papilio polytes]|uniref:uncharacterized protein LOC106109258 n=1 Tax=Papilio polytes TaxID=76194 RepID=UPI000675C190|nr:PREDICTED: uncharacterized protein LOC106109258 [Papilio polytes]
MCRLPFFIFLFVFVTNGQVVPKNAMEENILNILLLWQSSSQQHDSLPNQSLSTVTIPPVEYYYKGKGIRLDYTISEMILKGLDHFTVENISAIADIFISKHFTVERSLEVSLSLRFPMLTLLSDKYKLEGRAYYIYPLKGSGKMKLIFCETVIAASVKFGTNNKNGTKIQNFLLNYSVQKIHANLENSSWPINVILNNEGVEILAGYKTTIVEALRNHIVPLVDEYLKDISPSELLEMLN